MALRSGYKGFKKLLSLKMIRPGTLAVDDAALANTFFPRSEQAVLGAKNWFYSGKITDGQDYITDTDNGKTIRIHNTTAGSYKMGVFQMSVEKNTDYIFTTTVDWTSGVGNVGIATENAATDIKVYGQITSDKDVEVKFNSGNNSFIHVKLLCTWSDSAVGDVTYTNNMLRLATDTDSTYVPYAMTNKELTDAVAVKNGLSSVTVIEGATLSANDSFLRKQNNVISAQLRVNGVTANSGVNIATIPSGYIPSLTGGTVVFMSNASTGEMIPAYITINGYVRARSNLSSVDVNINFTYIAP